MPAEKSLEERLEKIKKQLLLRIPLMSPFVMAMQVVVVDRAAGATFSTDGIRIRVRRSGAEDKSEEQLAAMLMASYVQVMLRFPLRVANFRHWAAVKGTDLDDMQKEVLVQAGMHIVSKVYASSMLPLFFGRKEVEHVDISQVSVLRVMEDALASGFSEEVESEVEEQKDQGLAEDIEVMVNTSASIANFSPPETVPEGMARALRPSETKADWRGILTETAVRKSGSKPDYGKRDRKSHRRIFLPAPGKSKSIRPAFAFDTSGSMSEKNIGDSWSQFLDCLRQFDWEKVLVLESDSGVHEARVFTREEAYSLETTAGLKGGGGTSFDPALQMFESMKEEFDFLVYFTDGEAYFPEKAPDYRLIWVHMKETEIGNLYPSWAEVYSFV